MTEVYGKIGGGKIIKQNRQSIVNRPTNLISIGTYLKDVALGTCCICVVMSICRLVKLSLFRIHSAFVYQLLVQCNLEY